MLLNMRIHDFDNFVKRIDICVDIFREYNITGLAFLSGARMTLEKTRYCMCHKKSRSLSSYPRYMSIR